MDQIIGQGHGMAGRYAGLPDPFGAESYAKVVLLPVPFDQTSTYQKGSDKGPAALIEASRHMELYDIETDFEPYQIGIYTADPIQASNSEDMLKNTYKRTLELLNQEKFIIVLGGEHAISQAPIRATAEHYRKITVLQFDAHADLQPAYEDNPLSHASVMARVNEIPEVTKVVSVGIRSMSKEEVPFVQLENTFYAHQLDKDNLWIDKVLNQLEGPIYITFDLDVFEIGLMPSTGTPEPGGLSWDPVMKLLKRVFKEKQVVGCDVVELLPNPYNLAPDYLAAKLVYKMLSYKFSSKTD